MQSAKEAASNVAASAKAGMEKTKATAQEKAEKMTTRDPLKKEMAEQKKAAAFNEAERMKHETRAENMAARREHGGHNYAAGHGYTDTATTGTGAATGYSTGTTDLHGGGVVDQGPLGVGGGGGGGGHAHTHTGVHDPRRNTTGYGGTGGTF